MTLKSAEAGLIKVREKKKKFNGQNQAVSQEMKLNEESKQSSNNNINNNNNNNNTISLSKDKNYPYVLPSNEVMIKQVARLWYDDINDGRSNSNKEGFNESQFIKFCLDPDREVKWIFDIYSLAASTSADPDLEIEHIYPKFITNNNLKNNQNKSNIKVDNESGGGGGGYRDDVDMYFKAPWLAKMQPPKLKHQKVNTNAPSSLLRLSYIQGYQSHNCRGNARYSSDGQSMIYHAASIAIVSNITLPSSSSSSSLIMTTPRMDKLNEDNDVKLVENMDSLFEGKTNGSEMKNNKNINTSSNNSQFSPPQDYFREHSGEIRCMATIAHTSSSDNHSKGYTLVATGEVGHKPNIHVWLVEPSNQKSSSGQDIRSQVSLHGFHTHGIGYITFAKKMKNFKSKEEEENKNNDDQDSHDDEKIRVISIGLDPQHRIGVYDLSFEGGSLISSLGCSEDSHKNQVIAPEKTKKNMIFFHMCLVI